MTARSCPNCRSVGPPRMVGEDVDDLAYCLDNWHAPSPDTGGAMVSTASLPTHADDETARLVEELRQANLRHRLAERECAALRVEVDDARVIVERRGRIIKDMRASGSELIVARDAALAEVERLRGLVDHATSPIFAQDHIITAERARIRRESGLT